MQHGHHFRQNKIKTNKQKHTKHKIQTKKQKQTNKTNKNKQKIFKKVKGI